MRNPLHHEMEPGSRRIQCTQIYKAGIEKADQPDIIEKAKHKENMTDIREKDKEEKETESEDKKEGPGDKLNEKERDRELTGPGIYFSL